MNKKFSLLKWAKQSIRGLDDSHVFVGILDDKHPMSEARVQFMLHIGYCIMTNKKIILTAPHGFEMPPKLEAIADRVVRYQGDNLESLKLSVEKALVELGINEQ